MGVHTSRFRIAATGMSFTQHWMSHARRWMSSMSLFAICVLTPGRC
jgi:hypothetical protein